MAASKVSAVTKGLGGAMEDVAAEAAAKTMKARWGFVHFFFVLSVVLCALLYAPRVFVLGPAHGVDVVGFFTAANSSSSKRTSSSSEDGGRLVLDNQVHSPCSSMRDHTICCDRSSVHTDVCFMAGDVRTDPASLSLLLYPPNGSAAAAATEERVRPYPRKWERLIMQNIPEVRLRVARPPEEAERRCDVRHDAPLLVMSAGGYTGNLFHAFNDGLLPTWVTVQHLRRLPRPPRRRVREAQDDDAGRRTGGYDDDTAASTARDRVAQGHTRDREPGGGGGAGDVGGVRRGGPGDGERSAAVGVVRVAERPRRAGGGARRGPDQVPVPPAGSRVADPDRAAGRVPDRAGVLRRAGGEDGDPVRAVRGGRTGELAGPEVRGGRRGGGGPGEGEAEQRVGLGGARVPGRAERDPGPGQVPRHAGQVARARPAAAAPAAGGGGGDHQAAAVMMMVDGDGGRRRRL